jgi:plastocyanin
MQGGCLMNPTKRTRTLITAVAIAVAFVAAGCGSSGGSDASGSGGGTGAEATTTAAGGSAPVQLEGKVNAKGTKDISSDGAEADLAMELDDNSFSPTYVKAAPGAKVTVELENEGSNPHTFTLDDGTIDQKVEPGAKATVEVTIPDDGMLRFSCDFHGAMGMQGAFYTGAGDPAPSSSSGDTSTTGTSTTAASSRDGGY